MTQRSLTVGAAASSRSLLARDLATRLIKHQGSKQALKDAVQFLQQGAASNLTWADNWLSFTLSAERPNHIPSPPAPYGLKGGAARELIMPTLGVRKPNPPRDLDLIRRGSFSITSDMEMAQKWMTRDYLHGARVELIRDTSRYLTSRDLTINEVAIFDREAIASILAALDAVGCVIRPSQYRGGSIHRQPSLDGRVLLKMARLAAEAVHWDESALLVGIPDAISFSDFDLAIHLNKAFQRGPAIAREFVHILTILGVLPATSNSLDSLVEELGYLRHGEQGLLPDVPRHVPSGDEC